MGNLRLLHLSDLHFEAESAVSGVVNDLDRTLLYLNKPSYCAIKSSRLADWAWRNKDKFDAVLVTGDLAHTGREEDLKRALKFIEAPNPLSRQPWKGNGLNEDNIGALSNKQIIVMPGNHDRFGEHDRKPQDVNFDLVFKSYWQAGARIRAKFGALRRDGDSSGISIICVDFSFSDIRQVTFEAKKTVFSRFNPFKRYSFLGKGKVTKKIIAELERATHIMRRQHPGNIVVWAVHFSLDCKDRSLELERKHLLEASIKKMGIPFIISGHVHKSNSSLKEKIKAKEGEMRSLIAGSATGVPHFRASLPNNSFQLLDFQIDDSGGLEVDVTTIKWNKTERMFSPLSL